MDSNHKERLLSDDHDDKPQSNEELEYLLSRSETHPISNTTRDEENQTPAGPPLVADTNPAPASAGGGGHRRFRSWMQEMKATGGPSASPHHRRIKTSLRQLLDTSSHGLEVIAEDVQQAMGEVRQALHLELNQASKGDTYFMDMSMTRSLSVLPENIPDFVQEATGLDLPREGAEGIPLARYMALLGAVLAVSSNGTALSLLHGVAPALKLFWRMTATATLLSVIAIKSLWKREERPQLNSGHVLNLLAAVVCFTAHALLFFHALTLTSIGNTVIYANSQALLLIVGKVFVGEQILALEGGGVIVAFTGAILCSRDSEGKSQESSPEEEEEGTMSHAIYGDLLALGSAVAGVGYLTFAKAVRPHMPVSLFMFSVMALGALLVLLFMAVLGLPIRFSNDPNEGLFGWINTDQYRLPLLLHIALVCNVLGTMGFVRAMQYFDNVIIAVATLLEPMLASFIAFVFQVGVLPGSLGWLGNALVAVGTMAVVYPSVDKGGEMH